jgi:hypothetical protein
MLSPMGNPDAIEAFAATLDRRAGDLAAIGHRLDERAGSASWSCQRADRFRADMHVRRVELDRNAAELEAIAHDLRRNATQIRTELHALSVLEAKVRALFQRVYSAAVHPPWLGTPWSPHNLPPPGDPRWRSVARALGVY